MKVLVIVCSRNITEDGISKITNFNTTLSTSGYNIEYCFITGEECNITHSLPVRYNIINNKMQLSKVCDFITNYKEQLNYDWYIKTRPEIILYEPIDFNQLCLTSINARARQYTGPRQVRYGISYPDYSYSDSETRCVLDDQIYIFSNHVIKQNAFNVLDIENKKQDEWFHSEVWSNRGITKNVITIHASMRTLYPKHLNM